MRRTAPSLPVMARTCPPGCTDLVSQSERTWFGGRDGQCVPLISATGAATDGPDAPGHDGWGMSAAPAMALICLTGAERCECRRDTPGHDAETPVSDGQCQRWLV